MNEVLLILGMMAVTVIVRYPVLALVGRFDMPASVYRALKFVPVAVLTAISVPEMLAPGGEFSLHYSNAHLVGGMVAIAAAWRTRNLLITILLGMSVFFTFRYFFTT
jgi:branched-subunit amino acid transport protein